MSKRARMEEQAEQMTRVADEAADSIGIGAEVMDRATEAMDELVQEYTIMAGTTAKVMSAFVEGADAIDEAARSLDQAIDKAKATMEAHSLANLMQSLSVSARMKRLADATKEEDGASSSMDTDHAIPERLSAAMVSYGWKIGTNPMPWLKKNGMRAYQVYTEAKKQGLQLPDITTDLKFSYNEKDKTPRSLLKGMDTILEELGRFLKAP